MVTPVWVRRPAPGPRLIHVNATATGGGVAELLHGLVPAQAAAGTAVGWAVIGGDARFFAFTKRLHHLLHDRGDPATPEPDAVRHYRSVLAPQGRWLTDQLGPGDVVVLHDPQTLGLAPVLTRTGARVLWHCHIGTTEAGAPGPETVWRLFETELSTVDVVTTLAEFAPAGVPPDRRHLAAPAIEPASAKNRPLDRRELTGLLDPVGLAGTDTRMVLQVSRWDPLKDMTGVLRCVPLLPPDVHVVLAGNDPDEIPDDPEGRAVLAEVRALHGQLSTSDRERVRLVLTSKRSGERAALLINALQRRANVVLQKSLAEGFGLTVTEAMYKGRPVVAGDVGGLRQQISNGDNGLLVDPGDLEGVAAALRRMLAEPLLARRLGRNAARSAKRRYLMPRLVADYQVFANPAARKGDRDVQ